MVIQVHHGFLNVKYSILLRFFIVNICILQIFVVPLYCQKNNENMKQKKEMMEVTPEERELLERMRNYNKSYPNGYPQLLWDLQELFDEMVRQPYE